MRRSSRLAAAVAAVVALVGSASTAAPGGIAAAANRPGPQRLAVITPTWSPVSYANGFGGSAGLLRTADGRLHVLWSSDDIRQDPFSHSYSLHYSTVGAGGRVLASGRIFRGWTAIDRFPQLVRTPQGLRVIFDGTNGQSGSPYDVGTFYSATAGPSGTDWKLQPGSLSQTTSPPRSDSGAVAEPDGQPVTAWAWGHSLSYHVGVDPSVPATTPDVQIPVGPSGRVTDPTLVTAGGAVWAAWFNSSGTATMGYWVDRILAGKAGMTKAPGSGGTHLRNDGPGQPVALAVRTRGGEYLAYCAPTEKIVCAHIALWRVGAKKALTVPGSGGGQDSNVALAAAPGGHLWVLWYNSGKRIIQAVRTDAAATAFGPVLTIEPPPPYNHVEGLEAEGSAGPLDIVAMSADGGFVTESTFWAAQILPRP